VSKIIRVVALLCTAVVLLYLCEETSVRCHIPRSREPLGTVLVQRYDAIPEKNGKVEFAFEPPVNQVCVRTLLPHMGFAPCWYLSRHSEQRINY
jgi:hypothetical protein